MILRFFAFLFCTLISGSLQDDLLSTRCQSECLHELTQRYQENAEMKRNFRHHILTICKEDRNCSSCTLPCREALSDTGRCDRNACLEASDRPSCEKSCEFLHQIFSEKPGACPAVSGISNYECTAECRLDGDCPETSKCCASGCSRRCFQPASPSPVSTSQSSSTIPNLPFHVTVQERKRKRSAVVRWEAKRGNQQDALSDLYLVQWRWGLSEEAMTNWQTVALKNKDYAILKHLLSPGRYYQFRVASVNRHGTHGFSVPSIPFKLSKEAKAPGAPRDLILGESTLKSGEWSQMLNWMPPVSDLPITGYMVSWAASTEAEADTYELMLRQREADNRQHEKRDAEEEELTLVERDRTTVLVPAHATQTRLERLLPNAVYLVEVQATADSAEGQLSGEKALVFVRTRGNHPEDRIERLIPLDVPTGSPKREDTVEGMVVETPHFTDSLTTSINWVNSRICGPQKRRFLVKYTVQRCAQSGRELNVWREEWANECHLQLRQLDFQCSYLAQVYEPGAQKPSVAGTFETRSCEETPTSGKPPCDFVKPSLRCDWDFSSIDCTWERLESDRRDTVIGYRVVLTSPGQGSENITILPPQSRNTRFDALAPWREYAVEVQPITNRGVGVAVSSIIAPTDLSADTSEAVEERALNDLEFIELPLESAAPTSLRILLPLLAVFLLR